MCSFARRPPGFIANVRLAGNYPATVAMVLLALCPFIVVSTAMLLLENSLLAGLGTSKFGVQVAAALGNAGYCFGAVAAADLMQRFSKRALFLLSEAAFALASVLCAVAPGIGWFTAGRLVEGVSTGMLLVVSLPPLVTRYGVRRLPSTVAFVDLGLFGMATAGPLVGGLLSELSWRVLFGCVAVLGMLGLLLGAACFERDPDSMRRMGFDLSAIPFAGLASLLPFLAVAWLSRGAFGSPFFWSLLPAGLASLGILLVRQYRKERALMPLKLLSHTLPVTGVSVAMLAGAAFTALLELSAVYLLLVHHASPALTGLVLATQIPGVVAAALLFRRMLTTRWLPAFAFSGLGVVAGAGGLLLTLGSLPAVPVTAAAGLLLGFGAGTGVAPGLFLAGLSVPASRLGPTFALVELLRSEAAFLVAPILLTLAMGARSPLVGVQVGALVVLVGAGVGGLLMVGVLLAGRKRPHRPDLERWLDGEHPAFDSPPLAAVVRDV